MVKHTIAVSVLLQIVGRFLINDLIGLLLIKWKSGC